MRLFCASILAIMALSLQAQIQVHGFDFASFFSGIKSNDTLSTDTCSISSNQSVTTVTITPSSSKTAVSGSTINNLPSPSDEKVVWVGEATLTPIANNTQSSSTSSNFNLSSYASFLKSLLPEVSSRISDSYLQGQHLSSLRDSSESGEFPLLSVVNPPNVLRKALRRPSWMSSCRKCSISPCSCRSYERKPSDVDSLSTLTDRTSLSCIAEKKAFITPTVVLTESIEPPIEISTCYKLSTVTLPFVTRIEKVETEILTTSVPVTVNQTYLLTSSCPYITYTLSTHTEVKNVMVTSYSTQVHTKCTPFCYLSKTTTSTLVNVTVKTTMSYVDTLTNTFKKTITHSEWLPDCSFQHNSATSSVSAYHSSQPRKRVGSESAEADVVIMGKPKIFISPDVESDVVENAEYDIVSKSAYITATNTASTKCSVETSTEMVTERVTETITQTETSITTQSQTITHTSITTHSHTITHIASGSSAITSSSGTKERETINTVTSSIASSSKVESTSSATRSVSRSVGSVSQVGDSVTISDIQSSGASIGRASDSATVSKEASQTFTFNRSFAATTQAHFVPLSSSGSVTYGATVVIQCDDSGEPTSSSTSTVAITNLGTTTICNCTCCNSSAPILYVNEDKMNQISKQKAKNEVKSKNSTSIISTTNTTFLLDGNDTRANDTRLNTTTGTSGSRSKVSNTTTAITATGKGLNATTTAGSGKLLNATSSSITVASGKEMNATTTAGKGIIGATVTTSEKNTSIAATGLNQTSSITGTTTATGTSGKNAVTTPAATGGSISNTSTKTPPSASGSVEKSTS